MNRSSAVHGSSFRVCVAALCAGLTAWSVPSQAEPVFSLAGEARGFGAGIILGEPTGISVAYRPSGPSTFDGAIAWSVPEEKLHLHADYTLAIVSFRDPAAPMVEFPVYVGAGPRLHLGSGQQFDTGKSSMVAVRLPVGMGVQGTNVPVEGFLELVPVLGLYPSTRFDLDAALGVRVYLGTRLERVPDEDEEPPAAE